MMMNEGKMIEKKKDLKEEIKEEMKGTIRGPLREVGGKELKRFSFERKLDCEERQSKSARKS